MKRIFFLLIVLVGLFGTSFVSQGTYAADIPLGCKGSTASGPISPTATYACPDGGRVFNGGYQAPGTFAEIPLGCKNSTAKGQLASNANYACPEGGKIVNGKYVPAKCKSNEVEVALPILNGGNKCVNNDSASGGAIVVYLADILKLLSIGIGLVIVLMLVISGIQYIASTGDPAAIKSAKERIVNAITALVLFLLMYAILNFLIPGGLL